MESVDADTVSEKARLLVVDDDVEVLECIETILGSEFQVKTRTSGETALQLLEQEDFLVVISDFRMPGMNGLELLEKVQLLPSPTSGLLLTAHMEVLAQPAWLDGRSASIIFKPFKTDDLIQSVRQLVSMAQMRRKVRSGVKGAQTKAR